MDYLITKEEKQRDLDYEVIMFNIICRAFLSDARIKYNWFWNNLLIESLVIHTRVLIDFFYCDQKKYKSDIIAQDLLSGNVIWKNIRPPLPEILKDAKNKVNVQLAHLSEERILITRQGKKDWKIREIFNEMNKIIDCFNEEINN